MAAHQTTSTIGAAATPSPDDEIRTSVATDRNRDGKVELTFLNVPAGTVNTAFGTGTGTFGPSGSYATLAGAESLAVGDLNGDNKLDTVVGYETVASMSVYTGT